MDRLMCVTCGEFLLAVRKDGELVLASGESCPECGGTEFQDVGE